jgi:hypothetical protein
MKAEVSDGWRDGVPMISLSVRFTEFFASDPLPTVLTQSISRQRENSEC